MSHFTDGKTEAQGDEANLAVEVCNEPTSAQLSRPPLGKGENAGGSESREAREEVAAVVQRGGDSGWTKIVMIEVRRGGHSFVSLHNLPTA